MKAPGSAAPPFASARAGALLAALLMLPAAAVAQADAAQPIRFTLGIENLRLPDDENMGLAGGTLLFGLGDGLSIGPAVYGAFTGQRGGFLVGGVTLQQRWGLAAGWSLAAEFFAGGGGGAAAPVGGGLMLRPALTLATDIAPGLQLGLTASWVSFPSGQIDSGQLGLALSWSGDYASSRATPGDGQRALGLGFERMALLGSVYDFRDGSGRRIGLVGARAERRSAWEPFSWGLEASAAAQGDAAGYMEILGTAALSTSPWPEQMPGWRVGVRAGAGVGGGGAVPTGGGAMGKLGATSEWQLRPGWTLGAELGSVASATGSFRATQAQLWLALDLEPRPTTAGGDGIVRTEWVGAWQHNVRSQRGNGSDAALDTIGLKLNRYVGEHLYLSGQAYSAFAGGAGGYSVGLVGAGLAAPAAQRFRVGGELLVGAAGGGGVQTAGGAVVQGLAWAGWTATPRNELRAGLGAIRSFSGALSSPIVELSWSHTFEPRAR